MKRLIPLLAMLFVSSIVYAETFSISYEHGRIIRNFPRGTHHMVGLALSGGGARGMAHIGVLEVLEENGIRIDRIAGTSMGSIVGGLYAAGYSTRALRDIINNIDWTDTFSSTPKRRTKYIGEKETSDWPLFELRFEGFMARLPSSLSSGQRIASLISWLTLSPTYECERDFDKLPIPFRAITTDLKSDSTVVIGSGNLGQAIRASSTIPLLFAPVEKDGMLLVDGGLKNNLPVDTARDMGSDFVIAVAIDESMHAPDELENPLNIADQVTSIMMRNITRLSKDRADIVIEPDMENFSSSNFSDFAAMIEQGRKAAQDAVPALLDSLERLEKHTVIKRITHVFVDPPAYRQSIESRLTDYFIPGERTTYAAIGQLIEELWGSGRFISVSARLDERTGVLNIDVTPVPETVVVRLDPSIVEPDAPSQIRLPVSNDGNPDIHTAIASVDSLVRSIRVDGYSFAYIRNTTVDVTNGTLVIELIAPKITKIDVGEGITSRNSLIMREFETSTGEVFDLRKVMQSVDNLYGTDLYELVTVDVYHYEDGVGITVNLKEKNWTVARFGLRYDETFQSEGRITLTRENIMGFGNKLVFTGHTGSRRQLLMIENITPRVYKTYYTFNLKAYRSFRRRPVYENQSILYDYEDERYGTVISFGQQMDKLGNAMFEFKTETIRTRYAPSAKIKNAKKEYRSIIFRSLIDSYDRYPFPRNGHINLIFLESATEELGGSDQFVKIFWNWSFAKTVMRRHTLNGSVTAGTADPSTPIIDAFSLGGDGTRLNCYDTDSSASHYYADFPGLFHEERRGTRIAAAKIGYRLFVPRAFHLDLIYGIGNVWNSKDTITMDTLLQSYGVKGSFSTYFGPLSFGWGITSEGDDRTYLSAGWEF